MRRTTAIALAALACTAGCGGDEATRAAEPSATPATREPCPEGTQFVRARDVVGALPRGFALVPPAEPEALAAIARRFKRLLGSERWRGYDAKILVPPESRDGVAVMAINSDEKAGSPSGVVAGAEDAERDFGVAYEPIRIAGQEGSLQQTPDGGFLAVGGAGECALVLLLAETRASARRAASFLRPVG
jgi:hypothetical protein